MTVSLILADNINSPAHYAKGTPSSTLMQTPTDCKHTVSGSISLPFRGTFHLSLTVLILYRLPNIFSLTRWSSQIQSGFLVSRPTRVCTSSNYKYFNYRTFTLYGLTFQIGSSIFVKKLCRCVPLPRTINCTV